MGRPWRLLVDANASGHFNMGVDEALLSSAILAGTPSLRFYGWILKDLFTLGRPMNPDLKLG